MNISMKRILMVLFAVLAVGSIAGCASKADKVAQNLSIKAENFDVQRRIVGINSITDKVEFSVVGRCSIEGSNSLPGIRALVVTCKQGPTDYRKHYFGLSDNVFFIATQLKGLNVSEYHTEIILKPQNIVPDFDLVTGN